jgi:hypothetical protein
MGIYQKVNKCYFILAISCSEAAVISAFFAIKSGYPDITALSALI